VGRELDLLVPPFCGAVMARDQAGAVEAAKVSVDEGVSRLGLVWGAIGESEVPFAVLAPRVRREKRVLVFGSGLDVSPVAVEDVLAPTDEAPCAGHSTFIYGVRSDQWILTQVGGEALRRRPHTVSPTALRPERETRSGAERLLRRAELSPVAVGAMHHTSASRPAALLLPRDTAALSALQAVR
jgi:hypothetical protein